MLDDSCLKSLRDNEMECSVRMTERMDRICVFDGVRVLAMIGVFVWHTHTLRARFSVFNFPIWGLDAVSCFFWSRDCWRVIDIGMNLIVRLQSRPVS